MVVTIKYCFYLAVSIKPIDFLQLIHIPDKVSFATAVAGTLDTNACPKSNPRQPSVTYMLKLYTEILIYF